MARWSLSIAYLLCLITLSSGCPSAHSPVNAHPALYATPENTRVELLAPCRLLDNGQPAEPCKFRLHINVVQVKK